jgi:hypothetical protein
MAIGKWCQGTAPNYDEYDPSLRGALNTSKILRVLEELYVEALSSSSDVI